MTEVRAEEIRNRVKAEFDNHSYYVRKDLDAINEGSDFEDEDGLTTLEIVLR